MRGTAPAGAARRQHLLSRTLVLAATLALILLRLWIAHGRVGPVALPDEEAYLLDTRLLATGTASDLSGSPLYQLGYPLLLVPLHWLTTGSEALYRAVLTENAIVNGLVLPLAYLLGTRVYRMPRRVALPLAVGLSLLPAVVFYASTALTDAVLPTVVTAWLLLIGLWRGAASARARTASLLGASLLAVYADAIHSRGAVVAVTFLALLGLAFLRRLDRRLHLAAIGLLTLGGVGAATAANHWLAERNYPRGTLSLGTSLIGHLTSGAGLARTAQITAGELWTVGTSSFGLGLLALAVAAGYLLRRDTSARAVTTLTAVACTLLMAGAAAAAGVEEHRVGNWAYARYLDCLLPTLVVAAVAALREGSLQRRLRLVATTAALMAALALATAIGAGRMIRSYSYVSFDFPEISPLTGSWQSLRVGTATAAALVAFVVLAALLISRRTAAAVLAGIGLVAFGSYAAAANDHRITRAMERSMLPRQGGYLSTAGIPVGARVAVDDCCWMLLAQLRLESSKGEPVYVHVNPLRAPRGVDAVVLRRELAPQLRWRHWHQALTSDEYAVWTRDPASSTTPGRAPAAGAGANPAGG